MLIFVTGIKGGVGKSYLSILLTHYYLERKPIVIETDLDVPDVFEACLGDRENENNGKDGITVFKIDLKSTEGCARIFKLALENPETPIIVNSPPNNKESITHFGYFLKRMDEEQIKVVSCFVMGPRKDCLDLLNWYLQEVPLKTLVVLNQADVQDFNYFKSSELYKKVTVAELSFNISVTQIFNQKMLISEYLKEENLGRKKNSLREYLKDNLEDLKTGLKRADYVRL